MEYLKFSSGGKHYCGIGCPGHDSEEEICKTKFYTERFNLNFLDGKVEKEEKSNLLFTPIEIYNNFTRHKCKKGGCFCPGHSSPDFECSGTREEISKKMYELTQPKPLIDLFQDDE